MSFPSLSKVFSLQSGSVKSLSGTGWIQPDQVDIKIAKTFSKRSLRKRKHNSCWILRLKTTFLLWDPLESSRMSGVTRSYSRSTERNCKTRGVRLSALLHTCLTLLFSWLYLLLVRTYFENCYNKGLNGRKSSIQSAACTQCQFNFMIFLQHLFFIFPCTLLER